MSEKELLVLVGLEIWQDGDDWIVNAKDADGVRSLLVKSTFEMRMASARYLMMQAQALLDPNFMSSEVIVHPAVKARQ